VSPRSARPSGEGAARRHPVAWSGPTKRSERE
jgi:hypothetical protein